MQKLDKINRLLGIFFCVSLVSFTLPGLTQKPKEQPRLNVISEVKGKVEILRAGRKNYQSVFTGDFINSADKIRLMQGALAKVSCDNNSTWIIKTKGEFEVAKGCQYTDRPVYTMQKINTSPTLAGNDLSIPYLISPRNSGILTQQPTLRWNPVKGASNYSIKISGKEINWATNANQPMVVYSGKQPLRAGIWYNVIITANNGVSTKDKDDPTFFVLGDSDIRQVKTDIAQLQKQPLSNESKTIALAHLYRSNNLNADAIDVLEKLVKNGNKTTAVYQLLGNIYQQIELNLLARETYLTALKLAEAEKNLEAKASLQVSLGEVHKALALEKQSVQWFEKAQASYQDLGDEEKVRELEQKLRELKN